MAPFNRLPKTKEAASPAPDDGLLIILQTKKEFNYVYLHENTRRYNSG